MRLSKKFAAIAITATVAITATAAFAYWTTTGSGEGTATATAGVADDLSFATSTINSMFPGDSSQDVTVTVTNDATEKVYVADVDAYLSVVKASGAPAGTCDASDFLLNGFSTAADAGSAVSLGWTDQELAIGGSIATDGDDTIQFNDKDSNQDGCKSATVTLHYLAS